MVLLFESSAVYPAHNAQVSTNEGPQSLTSSQTN